MNLRAGDACWIQARVQSVTPHALIVVLVGPKGAPVTTAIDPGGPIIPPGRKPEPEEPTASI